MRPPGNRVGVLRSSRSDKTGTMANPNPSPATRFQPGSTPNPGGKTKEQKRLEIEAAEMAVKLRHSMLSSIMEKVSAITDASEFLTSDVLRLLKDSEDRAHGTPKQSVDVDQNINGDVVFKTVYEAKP